MDTAKFGSLPTEYPIIFPVGFTIIPGELYNPEDGTKTETPQATEYNLSVLLPIADVPTVRQVVTDALELFETTDQVTRTTLVVSTTDNPSIVPGTYEIFWITQEYELYGKQVVATFKGFGEPDTSRVAPGQTFVVLEGVANGTVVGTVKGHKPSLVLESRPDVPFSYNAASGVLSVSGKLDYETTPEYTLTIGGSEVTVWVLDAAENPIAEQSTYTFYLDPNTAPGTVIGTAVATKQGESGVNPVYSLVSGNTGGWVIDSVLGEIIYIGGQPLDDGQVLGVNYGGAEPLTVTLRVLPPTVVNLPILRFNLPPTLSNGRLVGSVGAEGVTASLVNPGFEVTDNKLYVKDQTQIEPGLIELTLDLASEGRTGQQQVYVVVADHAKVNEFWVAEDSTNGSGVGTVELGGEGSYSVTPTTLFSINMGTGELLVTNASQLTPGSYLLTITKGTQSVTATVKVYAVASSNTLELTVADATPVDTAIGTVPGQSPFTVEGSISPYSIDSITGEVKLASTPPSALNFTVLDGAGDSVEVAIALDTPTGDTGFVGAVYAGQSGQQVATKPGVLFSVGAIAFGQGSLAVKPDNLGSTSRNTEGKLVASKAAGLSLPVSAQATPAMVTALQALWAGTLETPVTVSVPGLNWVCWLLSFELGYGADGVSVTLDLRTI